MIPRVVLGCAIFGGVGSLPQLVGRGVTRDDAFALMDQAWSVGIRWFDTADAYAGGRSEEWLGDWIEATGNKPQLTTKTYNPMTRTGDFGLSAERVLRQVESSLKRLRVERIDLYLAHEFDASIPVEETFSTLQRLLESGVIAGYGVSNFTAEQLERVLSVANPALIQNSYSLFNRRDEDDVIPLAASRGVVYQGYSPLAGGWLSGKYRSKLPLPPDSRLALVPEWYEHIDEARAFDALAEIETLAAAHSVTVSELAHRWVLAQPGVASIVVGPRQVEHLWPIVTARDDPSDTSLIARLTEISAAMRTS